MESKNENNQPVVGRNSPETSMVNKPMAIKTIDHPRTFKVLVIGDSDVGKTTLTYRFCEGIFLEKSEATIGVDFRTRTLKVEGEDITLQLWDTAGEERFRTSMVRHYYRNAHAVIFVYDVTNPASFDNLKKWIEESNLNRLEYVPRILVGNKCDRVVSVTTNVAQKFADQNNMPLFETSARLDSQCDNVDAIFLTLAQKLKNHKHFMSPVLDAIYLHEAPKKQAKSWWCC